MNLEPEKSAAPPVKPKVLKKGDTVGIIAPSSPTFEPGSLGRTLQWLERLGLKHKLGAHTFESYSSYAGSDEARADDLHQFFADKSVSAVLPLRGGAGAVTRAAGGRRAERAARGALLGRSGRRRGRGADGCDRRDSARAGRPGRRVARQP